MLRNTVIRSLLTILVILASTTPLAAFKAPNEEILPPIQNSSIVSDTHGLQDTSVEEELEDVESGTASDGPAAGLQSEAGSSSTVTGLMKRHGCEPREQRTHIDEFGRKHVRMGQFYNGLPVVGGEVIVHYDSHGGSRHMSGKIRPGIMCGTTPAFEQDAAVRIALAEHSEKPGLKVASSPSLVIYGRKLAYHFVLGHGGKDPGSWHYYVCAQTGSVLKRFNNIRFIAPSANGIAKKVLGDITAGEGGALVGTPGWKDASGNYFLYSFGLGYGVYDQKARDWKHQPTRNWAESDPAAVSCARNLARTQRWVKNILRLNSFDNLGGFARGNVHVGTNYLNAYWDGRRFNFGDGDGIQSGPLVSLDIVAHEYGHAITQYTSDLIYSDESGALNESYSDIMGCAVEWAYQPIDYSGAPGYSDWLLGEDSWLASPAMRDMRDPKAYQQPSYYKGQYWYAGMQDNGGVHTNSGVQNYAFYLLAQGGSGSNEGRYHDIVGIGIEGAAKVAMRANMVYLTSTARYLDSRRAWVKAARELGYPVRTAHAVWDAVGVFDPQPAR